MKVSIIIPVYNLQKYVGKAVESCLDQTYKNIEIIVINDGSTDETEKVIKSFHDSRLRYFYKSNGGVSSARNMGVQLCTGDYITFLDGDDYISPDTIKDNIELISKNGSIDWLLFPVKRVDEEGKEIELFNRNLLKSITYDKIEKINAKGLLKRYENNQVAPCVCGGIYKRNFFDVKFPEGRFEDTYIFLSLLEKHGNILISNKGLYYYVDRGDSFINTPFDAKKWLDYTRVGLKHIQVGCAINAAEKDKYDKMLTAKYYNLRYLRFRNRHDPDYSQPLDYLLENCTTIKKSFTQHIIMIFKNIVSIFR